MSDSRIGPGALVAVVGPSGSGKDTLLRLAREHFASDPDVVFPQRAITRAAGDDNEDHLALTPQAFRTLSAEGGFALEWSAHGLSYGIPISIDEDIAMGRTVVANLSRSMISTARVRYLFCQAVAISIDAATMRQRLIARGRESQADIEARIARLDLTAPQGYDAVIDNTGPLQDPADRLQAIIASGRNRDRTPMRFTSC